MRTNQPIPEERPPKYLNFIEIRDLSPDTLIHVRGLGRIEAEDYLQHVRRNNMKGTRNARVLRDMVTIIED